MKLRRQFRLNPESLPVNRTSEKAIVKSELCKEIPESSEIDHEGQLPEIRWLKEELERLREVASGSVVSSRDNRPLTPHGTRFCAYDRTRQRFLSNQVDICDSDPNNLEVRLANFVPGAGAALWVTPFGELPLTILRFPVDLVYLDHNDSVLDAVESFPLSTSGSFCRSAASVLVLTARTISSVGIESGDQLILCRPEEMELLLSQPQSRETQLAAPLAAIQSQDRNSPGGASVHENLPDKTGVNLPQAKDQSVQMYEPGRNPQEAAPSESEYPSGDKDFEESGEERRVEYSKKKSWWRRFLAGEPPDPREAERESIPGLIAYFFTGGAPIAHRVRDISANGVYVFTDERWYPDTVVRITLSDEREPSRETTLTVHARVARGDKNGVGLQFVLTDKKTQEQNIPAIGRDQEVIVTKEQVEAFVKRFKSSRG